MRETPNVVRQELHEINGHRNFLSSYLIIPGHDHIYTDARAPNLLYLQHLYNDRLFKKKIHQETVHIGASMASPRDFLKLKNLDSY